MHIYSASHFVELGEFLVIISVSAECSFISTYCMTLRTLEVFMSLKSIWSMENSEQKKEVAPVPTCPEDPVRWLPR